MSGSFPFSVRLQVQRERQEKRLRDSAKWVHYEHGMVLFRNGLYSSAGKELSSAVKLLPEDLQARLELGSAAFKAGILPVAERELSKAYASEERILPSCNSCLERSTAGENNIPLHGGLSNGSSRKARTPHRLPR